MKIPRIGITITSTGIVAEIIEPRLSSLNSDQRGQANAKAQPLSPGQVSFICVIYSERGGGHGSRSRCVIMVDDGARTGNGGGNRNKKSSPLETGEKPEPSISAPLITFSHLGI